MALPTYEIVTEDNIQKVKETVVEEQVTPQPNGTLTTTRTTVRKYIKSEVENLITQLQNEKTDFETGVTTRTSQISTWQANLALFTN